MKTKLILLAVLVTLILSVNAQNTDNQPIKVGVGAMIGLPMGDLNDMASLAWGIDVMGEYAVDPSFALTLSIGYVDFVLKSEYKDMLDELDLDAKMGMIPVLAGAKYFFTDNLYGSGQIGISFSTQKDGGSAFTFAPGIGYKMSENLDLLLKYQSASDDGADMSFLGLRVGISF